MRALIFGVSGQDGAYLSQLLLAKGYEVYGTSRLADADRFQNLAHLAIREKIKIESVSLHDFRSVLQVLVKIKPDEVYNLAGQSSVALSFEQPIETWDSISIGTLNLLEAIRFSGRPVKLYNAASSECFGNVESQADECTPFRPRSPYAVAKSAAFWQVANYREAYGLFACSGILFNHESPLRSDRFITKKIVSAACRIAAGGPEKLRLGNFAVERDWGWAPEYVNAMWLMLQREQPDDFVIATGESRTLREFVDIAFKCVGLHWREFVQFDDTLRRPTDVSKSRGNPQKAAQVLGWRATHKLEDVVRIMVESERSRLV